MRRLMYVLCAVVACSGSTDESGMAPPPPGTIRIVPGASTLGSGGFQPNPITLSLATNATLTIANADRTSGGVYGGGTAVAHWIVEDSALFDTGTLAAGGSAAHTFTAAGTYTYHCQIHAGMTGRIVVDP